MATFSSRGKGRRNPGEGVRAAQGLEGMMLNVCCVQTSIQRRQRGFLTWDWFDQVDHVVWKLLVG